MGRGNIGTACTIIFPGFPQGEIRNMLKKALARKSLSESNRTFLQQVNSKKKLSQEERKRIRKIYREGK